jgi:hypothetical protein
LLQDVRGDVQEMDPTTVIFQLLDSSRYYVGSQDSSRIAPRKEKEGVYYLGGEVTLSSKETQQERFRAIKPLLEATNKMHSHLSSVQICCCRVLLES